MEDRRRETGTQDTGRKTQDRETADRGPPGSRSLLAATGPRTAAAIAGVTGGLASGVRKLCFRAQAKPVVRGRGCCGAWPQSGSSASERKQSLRTPEDRRQKAGDGAKDGGRKTGDLGSPRTGTRGKRVWSPEALLPGTGEACGEGARLLRSLASIREPRFRAQAELAHSRRPTTEGRRRSERRRTEDRRPGIAAYGSMGKASLESGSFASGHRRSLW